MDIIVPFYASYLSKVPKTKYWEVNSKDEIYADNDRIDDSNLYIERYKIISRRSIYDLCKILKYSTSKTGYTIIEFDNKIFTISYHIIEKTIRILISISHENRIKKSVYKYKYNIENKTLEVGDDKFYIHRSNLIVEISKYIVNKKNNFLLVNNQGEFTILEPFDFVDVANYNHLDVSASELLDFITHNTLHNEYFIVKKSSDSFKIVF